VRYVIERTGSVGEASLEETTLGDEAPERCIVEVFSTLQFPSPEGGPVNAVYPMVFSPGHER
jgi:hypothetical protein